jgi:hypothetical protein
VKHQYAFLVNGFTVGMKLRHRPGNHGLEAVAVDPVIGEFALDGTERLEAKDLRLAEAMNYQPDDGFRTVTLEQLREILVPTPVRVTPKHLL